MFANTDEPVDLSSIAKRDLFKYAFEGNVEALRSTINSLKVSWEGEEGDGSLVLVGWLVCYCLLLLLLFFFLFVVFVVFCFCFVCSLDWWVFFRTFSIIVLTWNDFVVQIVNTKTLSSIPFSFFSFFLGLMVWLCRSISGIFCRLIQIRKKATRRKMKIQLKQSINMVQT